MQGLAIAALATSTLASAAGTYSSFAAASAAKKEAAFRAKAAELDALRDANETKARMSRTIGAYRAFLAGTSVDPFTGSAQHQVRSTVQEFDDATRMAVLRGKIRARSFLAAGSARATSLFVSGLQNAGRTLSSGVELYGPFK